ncbi:MAG: hypothetical protein Q7R39_10565 [Dehalococcoidia bacterium]|nr:hypothetical protein [Dehalococcoidia bacterium]
MQFTLKWTLLAAAVAAVTGATMFAAPRSSGALPDYSVKAGQPCGICHVNPAGGGALTTRGLAFAAVPYHASDPAGAFLASQPTPVPLPAVGYFPYLLNGLIPAPTPTMTVTPTPTAPVFAQPTLIPHSIEGRSACTTCHLVGGPGVGAPGGTGLPGSHAGRTASVCLACHRPA